MSRIRQSLSLLTAVSFSLALGACAHNSDEAQIMAATHATADATSAGPNGAISDADAGAIAWTINDGEIQLANLAASRASSQNVRDFAQMMITDHTNANAMLTSAGYGKKKNPVVTTLHGDVTATMQMLQNRTGMDFDHAYIDSQVKMHQTALDSLNTTLIPSANDKALRNVLTNMRPTVEQHLQQAKSMKGNMGNMNNMQH
jgi:putative membrane protein